jgi:hypothetical protein
MRGADEVGVMVRQNLHEFRKARPLRSYHSRPFLPRLWNNVRSGLFFMAPAGKGVFAP